MIPPPSPSRRPWRAAVFAASFLLGACSVGFDVPLSVGAASDWQDGLTGYWKVEREGEDEAAVALIRKRDDGAFRLHLLGPDSGSFSADLGFASHGGRDYAILDFNSYEGFDPVEREIKLIREQTALGIPLLPSDASGFGVVLLRRKADEVRAYELNGKLVMKDLMHGPLAGTRFEGCDPELPNLTLDGPETEASEMPKRPHWACIVQLGQEAALRAYLEARGDAIFDLDKPTRFTKLF